MKPRLPERRLLIAGAVMAASAGLAYLLTPRRFLSDALPPVDLERWFPAAFGDWLADPSGQITIRSPDVQEKIDQIYNRTLERTYLHRQSRRRVMLSVAYGGDQSDAMSAHLPEVCYPAQGFELRGRWPGHLKLAEGAMPVVRLSTSLRQRNEQIMYWVSVAGRPTNSRMSQKLAQMRVGLRGWIPDGMLVRVSEIEADRPRAFELLDVFTRDLLGQLDAAALKRLTHGD